MKKIRFNPVVQLDGPIYIRSIGCVERHAYMLDRWLEIRLMAMVSRGEHVRLVTRLSTFDPPDRSSYLYGPEEIAAFLWDRFAIISEKRRGVPDVHTRVSVPEMTYRIRVMYAGSDSVRGSRAAIELAMASALRPHIDPAISVEVCLQETSSYVEDCDVTPVFMAQMRLDQAVATAAAEDESERARLRVQVTDPDLLAQALAWGRGSPQWAAAERSVATVCQDSAP